MTGGAAAYWSAKQGYAPNWYSFCGAVINERITGDPALAPTPWALRSFPGKPAHLLEIGCLQGDKLAAIFKAGLAKRVSGVDIAADAIAAGRHKHGGALALAVVDLNTQRLLVNNYNVVLSNGVLHHIAALEFCVQSLYDALTPGGILVASEFTGPRRHAYSTKEIRLINEGMAMLPADLRGQPFDPAQLKPKLDADPSESIRTRDIGPVLAATFDEVVARPYGGNVLMRALTATFFERFDASPRHNAAMAELIAFDAAVSAREPSHHHFFVARKAK